MMGVYGVFFASETIKNTIVFEFQGGVLVTICILSSLNIIKYIKILKYDNKLKLNGVKYKQDNHLSLNQASIDIGILSGTLARWEKIYLEEGEVGFMQKVKNLQPKVMKNKESKLSSSTEKGIKKLTSENDKLTAEVAYLKKCIALAQEKTKLQTKKKL